MRKVGLKQDVIDIAYLFPPPQDEKYGRIVYNDE